MTQIRTLTLIAFLVCGCTKKNPSFCETSTDCSEGLRCEESGHICVPDVDAAIIPADASLCFGAGSFSFCLLALPSESVTLPTSLDTTDSPLCAQDQYWTDINQVPACFVVAKTITVPSTRVTGSRPLVLAATEEIDVVGYVDAAAHRVPSFSIGPGGPGLPCPTGSLPQNGTGAGGGAGGSYQGKGGDGGNGNGGASGGGVAASPLEKPMLLRGGCSGFQGGSSGGGGGIGGGAVYIATHGVLHLSANAILNISGSGGLGAPTQSTGGGGGGGTGGTLILHATAFAIEAGAKVVANGGGGGAGATSIGAGSNGLDPDPTAPLAPAGGGNNGGGHGGNGFAQGLAPTRGLDGGSTEGGGGGGGGAGYIRANHALSNVVASPDPHVVPF